MALPTTANTSNPRGFGFGARLDELLLRLAEAPGRELVVQDAEMEADRVNTAQTPEAYLSAFGDVFARSEFWGGEGLQYAHRRENLTNAFARFWDSQNVDVNRDPGQGSGVVLSHGAASLGIEASQYDARTHRFAASNNHGVAYHPDSGKLYMAYEPPSDGPEPRSYQVSTSPTAASPLFYEVDPNAGETTPQVFGTTFLGADVYTACGNNGIHRDEGAADSFAHWSDLQCSGVWAAKSRIIARGHFTGTSTDETHKLYSVTSGGAAPAPLKTLDFGNQWFDVVDAGAAVLATAEDGAIYAFSLNDSDTLVQSGETQLNQRVPLAITQAYGRIFYLTAHEEANASEDTCSLWSAQLSSEHTLVDQQLLRTWSTEGVRRLTPVLRVGRSGVYAGIVDEDGVTASIWRYDLDDGAITRHLQLPDSSSGNDTGDATQVNGLEVIGDRIFATQRIDNLAGEFCVAELFREQTIYADSGYLIGPAGDLFTADDKSWVTAKLDAVGLNGNGEQVDFYLSTNLEALDDPDHADWDLVKSYTSADNDEIAVSRFSRYIAGMVKLSPSTDGTSSPRVRSFAFRSYPPPGDVLIELPVNVSDQISSAGRRPRRVPGRGKEIFNELLSRSGREATLELYRHGITVTGLVERVSVPSPELGEAGSPTAHAMLRFRGRKATLVQV